MKYKGYIGTIEEDWDDDGVMFTYGKVLHIKALISYEANDYIHLEIAFVNSINDYLALCEEQGIEPEIPDASVNPCEWCHLDHKRYT